MDIDKLDFARKKNSGELKKSANLFSADTAGAFAPPDISREKSDLAAAKAENIPPAAISLEEIRAELRSISGTLLRDDADRLRRRALWRRLDQLGALAWGCRS